MHYYIKDIYVDVDEYELLPKCNKCNSKDIDFEDEIKAEINLSTNDVIDWFKDFVECSDSDDINIFIENLRMMTPNISGGLFHENSFELKTVEDEIKAEILLNIYEKLNLNEIEKIWENLNGNN